MSHPGIGNIEATTVRGTRLRFPEANQAAPSFVPDHPVNGIYTKPYTSAEDLIPILQGRGLEIPDPATAVLWLRKVGYYRITGYGLQFRVRDGDGKLTDDYRPGTRFEDFTDLYEFDRHLRLLVLDAQGTTHVDATGISRTGLLYRNGEWPTIPRCVKVTYLSGWTDAQLNGDAAGAIKLAAIETVAAVFKRQKDRQKSAGPKISESIGKYSYSTSAMLATDAAGLNVGIPASAIALLQPYRNYGRLYA